MKAEFFGVRDSVGVEYIGGSINFRPERYPEEVIFLPRVDGKRRGRFEVCIAGLLEPGRGKNYFIRSLN